MYLKRIEVQGFKSFANKITFDFHQGITGIVGPNGSGKSNVSDAVRWVLGEQSARQLRGGNMQDVIFAGTQMRKPLGFAHVALTIDNSHRELAVDFSEVVVARRLYRSGESEYSINGSPCRLRDIQEIFYDTGIGKDGYSIIGQGQVDKILSGRSEERRELFDEAAGITKFKRRKTVALRKLESEENNLLRISDRLEELKKQLEPLKRQSETAREFLHLRETLKQMDASLFVLESKELGERLKEYDEKEGILEEDLARVKTEAETLRRDYNALEEEVMSLEKEAEAIREERDSLSGSMRQQEEKIRNAKEQIRTAQTNTGHFRLRMENIEATLKKNEELSDGYRQRKKQLEMSQREDTGRYEESKKTLEELEGHIHEKEDELAFQNMQKMHLLEERSEFLGSSKKYEALLEQLQIRSSENNRKLLESRSQLEEYTKKETELQEELLEIEEREKKLLSRETEWTAKEEALLNEKARLEKKIADLQYSYQNKTAKLESLRNIAERYEGYGVSIKKIMEAKDRIRGIHGVIADLITVDKNYETAVETALGGRIQNIVTDSEETAKVLIAYLKKNAYGRATFLPLTALQKDNFSPNPSVLSEKGVIGMASDLVETREIYRPLLNRLLGGVYVVEHVDDGIALARKFRHSLRIVTREGELFSPGGAISGGAFKNSSGLLGRKRELEELEDLIAKDEALSLKHASTLSEIQKEWEEWESHRLSLEKERQEEWIKENTCRQSLELLQGQLAAAHVQLSGFLEERERLKKEMEESAMLSRDILASIQEIDERTREDEGLFDASSKEIARLRKEREDLLHRLSEHEIRLAGLHQTRDFLEENLGRLKDEMIGLLEEKEDLAQQVLQNLQRIETEKAEIEDIEAKRYEQEDLLRETSERLDACLKKKQDRSSGLKEFFERREETMNTVSLLDKDLFRIVSARERAQEKLDGLVSHLWNEYNLAQREASEFALKTDLTMAQLRKEIDALRASIRGLGDVNVRAIEDYRETSDRYTLMLTQYDDVMEAKQKLLTIITDLDEGMRRIFTEKFAAINETFDTVFRSLFGGGTGRLVLEEEADILEADISIISQPPGKKLQNMMQLSGGEKALTAISLLFAIQSLKPSPFVLLDEIEAALDDSNVERFAKYLHRLSNQTQFIVITHRRGTMVASDRLYGITMQEKGVSTLVSVSLIEDKLS